MKKKHAFPLVEVRWEDSTTTSGWRPDVEDIREPLTCWSAGYLIENTKRSVIVALNASAENSRNGFGDCITIPRACVREIRKLR